MDRRRCSNFMRIFLALAAILVLAGHAQAISGPNYHLDWLSPLASSGGAISSAHYAIQFTVGQTVTGLEEANNNQVQLGFWPGVLWLRLVFLPMVFR